MDHRGHQAQHAARALELHQGGPIGVEPVEDLRVDRIRGLDAFLVVATATLGRELGALCVIEVRERPRGHVTLFEGVGSGERLKQTPPHDLETFFGSRWTPRRLHAPNHVAQPVECLAPADAAHLHVVRLRVRRALRVRSRQRNNEQAVPGELGRLRERLGKGELGLEAPRGKVALIVELACVGHPLIDQDQAWPVLLEQLAQHVAWVRRPLVVGLDARERLLAAELVCQLAPQRAHHGPVRLGDRIPWRDLVSHQDHALHLGQALHTRGGEHCVDTGQFARFRPREQVVERQHGVGLAAAEVGLE